MFAALDTNRGAAVTDGQKTASDGGKSSELPVYECLNCGEPLEYIGQTARCQQFQHRGSTPDCFNAGNVSSSHRLCQEAVAARLVNHLPVPAPLCEVEFEKWVVADQSFLIPDVQLTAPGRLAIEVVNKNQQILERRLHRLLAAGYGIMVVRVTTGPATPNQLQQRLEPVAPATIGRFDPVTEQLSLGSIVTPGDVAQDAADGNRTGEPVDTGDRCNQVTEQIIS